MSVPLDAYQIEYLARPILNYDDRPAVRLGQILSEFWNIATQTLVAVEKMQMDPRLCNNTTSFQITNLIYRIKKIYNRAGNLRYYIYNTYIGVRDCVIAARHYCDWKTPIAREHQCIIVMAAFTGVTQILCRDIPMLFNKFNEVIHMNTRDYAKYSVTRKQLEYAFAIWIDYEVNKMPEWLDILI
uniref:Uncharacterized protein n=1 Tax=Megaviridae environmental sample TaxID=1737588 RepID=A0A5J6VJC7_9VIRU|nr:MAG: hypothetical protein [Megaviridae environmental sample]